MDKILETLKMTKILLKHLKWSETKDFNCVLYWSMIDPKQD